MLFRFLILSFCLLLAACGGSSSSTAMPKEASPENNSDPNIALGIPTGAPAAALKSPVELEKPPMWPFGEGAPRTSGTGRYANGAYYWTDFIYDAAGAKGPNPPIYRIGTPSGGSMHYPDADMAGNGADIFVVGVAADDEATYWRVDWQTLLNTEVPVAAFGIDYQVGGFDDWPGIPVLKASGIDVVIFISATGVYLDFNDGQGRVSVGEVSTDLASRSFVAKIPRTDLPPAEGTWTVYLVSGINDGEGGFLADYQGFRSLPIQPPVFNVAFRDYQDESPLVNFWFDEAQATALASGGDISTFSGLIDWSKMGTTEPEPLVYGYSNRWYVSSVSGQELEGGLFAAGVDRREQSVVAHPMFFDQVQPYGIYIPSSYQHDSDSPAMLTWMLHSLTQNHNQYSASVPNFQDAACERLRQSICVTTLGRGPAGSYSGSAELDFWEVWADVSRYYTVDTERVISSGYSMGAIATINLMIKYPDVFAGGVVLAGSHANASYTPISLGVGGVGEGRGPELLQNIKWNGYYQAHGSFDQLVPFYDARATVNGVRDYAYRYVFDHYLAEDHIIWTLKDVGYSAFEEAAKWIVEWLDEVDTRKVNPGDFIYRWEPKAINAEWGIGPRGPWYIADIAAVDGAEFAQIAIENKALPEAAYIVVDSPIEFLAPSNTTLSPAVRERQTWEIAEVPSAEGTLSLTLNNVSHLTIDLAQAAIAGREDKRLLVNSDKAVELRLAGLAPATNITALSSTAIQVSNGLVTISLSAGDNQLIEFD